MFGIPLGFVFPKHHVIVNMVSFSKQMCYKKTSNNWEKTLLPGIFCKFHDQWLGSPMGSLPTPFGRRSLRNKQQMYGNMEKFPVTNSALFGLVGFI